MKTILISLTLLLQLGLYAGELDPTSTKTTSDSNITLWNTTVDLGVQLLPDYGENGENKGYSKSRLFVDIIADSRWIHDINNTNYITWNTGGNIKLLGTASNDSNSSTLQPTSFNDVSDTIDASIYIQVAYRAGLTRNIYSEIGLISHLGVRSREKKSDLQDTVDTYFDIGGKYSFYRENPYSQDGIAQSLPDGYVGVYYRKYSDYNGFKDSTRTIVDFKYKITAEYNFLIGCEVNLGDYEDELYLTLTFRNGIEELFGVFGTKKQKPK